MTEATTKDSRFDYGRVINRTLSAIGANLRVFALLTLILLGIPTAVIGAAAYGLYINGNFDEAALQGPGAMIFLLAPVVYIVLIAAVLSLQAAIIHGVIVHLNGRQATLGESLASGWRHWFIMVLISIVTGVAQTVGLLLFIVPGVLMMLAWSVAIPVRVAERKGVFASMERSADLTRGRRGSLLGLFVLYSVATNIIQQIVQAIISTAVTMAAPSAAPSSLTILTPTIAAAAIMGFVISVVSAAGLASVYFELRSIREGVSPADLASIFD